MSDLSILANVDYLSRINRAIDHVTQHLAEPLELEQVAKVACFSPFHFHRIFRSAMGETLHDFVKRVRLERAVYLLAHHGRPSLTEIALACGFGSSSDFSRSFKKHYGVSPRAFDVSAHRDAGRGALHAAMPGGARLERLPEGENPDGFSVCLRELPARRVAYLRVFRPYGGGAVEAAARLLEWASKRGLEGGQWLGYQWDDPEIVPLDQCRYDVGVEIPEGIAVGDGPSEQRFAPMKVAEIALDGPIDVELRALDYLYRAWLPRSGYAPAHEPCFEAWEGAPFAHGTVRFALRLQLAVVDASAPL